MNEEELAALWQEVEATEPLTVARAVAASRFLSNVLLIDIGAPPRVHRSPVYVLEGLILNWRVMGVFSSPEKAMAAWMPAEDTDRDLGYAWRRQDSRKWLYSNITHDAIAEITAHDMDGFQKPGGKTSPGDPPPPPPPPERDPGIAIKEGGTLGALSFAGLPHIRWPWRKR